MPPQWRGSLAATGQIEGDTMKYTKAIALAALAVFGTSMLPIDDAEARHRLKWRRWHIDPDFGFYRPGPGYIPYPYYEDEDYDAPPRYAYAPDYYEPEYVPRPRKRKQQRLYNYTPEAKPAKPKPKLISCKKASGIVSSYGFDGVKATDCKGDSYAFEATRDGRSFAITLNSVNGELTKVKKQ